MNTLSVWTDKDRHGGLPCVKGSRFSVAQLLAEIAEGRSLKEVVNAFGLDPKMAQGVLDELALWFNVSWVDGVPPLGTIVTEAMKDTPVTYEQVNIRVVQ